MIFVRYADDLVAGFEHESDARRFWDAMRMRFERFGLELHGDKTRLLEPSSSWASSSSVERPAAEASSFSERPGVTA